MAFQDKENKTLRSVRSAPFARVYRRWYSLAPESVASNVPARGTLVDLRGVTVVSHTHDLLGVRVHDYGYKQQAKGRLEETWIEFIEPLPYAATASTTNYQELLSSRQTSESRGWDTAIRIGVSDDQTDSPEEGDFYPGSSGLTGLKCSRVVWTPVERSPIVGLWFQTAYYQGRQSYSGT